MTRIKNFLRNKKGAVLVEYALLVAGIAIVGIAAVSILGHKTSDLLATSAAIIPGVSDADNDTISSGRLLETAENANGDLAADVDNITARSSGAVERLGDNLGYPAGELPLLVVPTTP